MALIITAGSRDGKNYTDCNSLCTSHPGRLPRAAPSFAFSLSQPINYSLLTLESKLKQPAAHHQNRRSGRRDAAVLQIQAGTGSLVHGCTRVRTRSGFDESVDRQQPVCSPTIVCVCKQRDDNNQPLRRPLGRSEKGRLDRALEPARHPAGLNCEITQSILSVVESC